MTKIIQRHDTAANWTTINPILASGEIGVETDTNKFKFGDGVTAWNSLAYAAGEGGGSSGTTLTSTDGTTTYSKLALGNNLVVDTGYIAWTNPKMTSNSQNGYIITYSNTAPDNGAISWKAFDKDTTSPENCWWSGSKSMPQWIMLECPEPIQLTSCMIMNELSSPANMKSGIIQGSIDGSTFDDLYTITNRQNTTGLKVTYNIDTTKYYKYLRVYITESYTTGVSIQEIEFSGFVKDPAVLVPTLNVDAYTKTETDELLSAKQDKLIAVAPIVIKTDRTLLADLQVNGTIVNNGDGSYTNPISTAGRTNWVKVTPHFDCIYTPDWEIIIPFIWNQNSGKPSQTLIGGEANSLYVTIEDNNFRVWYASGGYISTHFLPTIGQKSWLRFKYTGGTFYVYYSTNGIDWTLGGSKSKSYTSAANTETYFFGGAHTWQENARGGMFTVFFNEIKVYKNGELQLNGIPAYSNPYQAISANTATTSSLGVVQPDGTSITVNEAGIISGQDVKTFTGYSDTGTLVLKSINGVLQWVAE